AFPRGLGVKNAPTTRGSIEKLSTSLEDVFSSLHSWICLPTLPRKQFRCARSEADQTVRTALRRSGLCLTQLGFNPKAPSRRARRFQWVGFSHSSSFPDSAASSTRDRKSTRLNSSH